MNKCVFCELIEKGKELVEDSRYVGQSRHNIIILSNPALVYAHLLVIPKRHIERLSQLEEDEKISLFNDLIKYEEILLKKYPGCDKKQNYRPFIPDNKFKVSHLHFHLQPRELEDELYKRSQIYEKSVFRDLSANELKEIKNFIFS